MNTRMNDREFFFFRWGGALGFLVGWPIALITLALTIK